MPFGFECFQPPLSASAEKGAVGSPLAERAKGRMLPSEGDSLPGTEHF